MFFKVKKETLDKMETGRVRVSAMLSAVSAPPGFFGRLFGDKTDASAWVEARDKLNKVSK